ncbi:HAD-IA family hydrolase [Dactylosporangium sp. NPDC049525]|uniref:HAD family hydrolase n=1 Tax=Dactylosporangium sp. NPDC049525 TaxID=3154730 RepID=UPI0034156E9B
MTSTLADVMSRAKALLLDFDGPVCSLFATYSAPAVAERLRQVAAAQGFNATANEPLALLREVDEVGDAVLSRVVAQAVRDAEIEAAAGATPTPGIEELLHAARAGQLRIAIVSNNATEAVTAYLKRARLNEHVDLVVGRYENMPAQLLKPNPHLLNLALDHLSIAADVAVFVGDSVTDVKAGHATGVQTIGFANKPGKRERLNAAGAVTVIDRLAALTDASIPGISRLK